MVEEACRCRTDRFPDFFDPRTRSERAADKSGLVYAHLLHALRGSSAWTTAVEGVRGGADALDEAQAWACAPPRHLVAEMLLAESDGSAARAYFAPANGDRGASRYSEAFWMKAARGIECIVRRGDQVCLDCGDRLPAARESVQGPCIKSKRRVAYCAKCQSCSDPKRDEHAIGCVFASIVEPPVADAACDDRISLPLAYLRSPVERSQGECAGCGEPIDSDGGVAVSSDGGRWHPECRRAFQADRAKPAA